MWLIDFLFHRKKNALQSTQSYERYLEDVGARVRKYQLIAESEELQVFLKLKAEVEKEEFQQKKKIYTQTQYKDTDEGKKMARLASLNRKLSVIFYRYLEGKNPQNTAKLQQWAQKPTINEYLKLKEETSTPEFIKWNAFWKDKNRWLHTKEGEKEQEFIKESKQPNIHFFFDKKNENLHKLVDYQPVFDDDFTWKTLDESQWQAGFIYPGKEFVRHHTYTYEQQAYAEGLNTTTQDSWLTIKTHKESKNMLAWDEKNGFIKKDFEYTSDVINNAETFHIQQGCIVQVKACVTGKINHCICLKDKNKLPILVLMGVDKKGVFVGLQDNNGLRKARLSQEVNPNKPFIYTIVWKEKELSWYVNNMLVHQLFTDLPTDELFMQLYSFIPAEIPAGEGSLKVDWVRCYAKK